MVQTKISQSGIVHLPIFVKYFGAVDEISCVEYQLCLSVVGVGKESYIISFHLCTAAMWDTISFKKVRPAIRGGFRSSRSLLTSSIIGLSLEKYRFPPNLRYPTLLGLPVGRHITNG